MQDSDYRPFENGRMDKTQQELSYATARSVADGHLSPGDGARKLHSEAGLNLGSAQALVYVYMCMRKGVPFKRALSSTDLNYFLEQILQSEGSACCATALEALRGHISYREGMRVSQRANRKILQKYEAILDSAHRTQGNDEFVPVPFFIESDGTKTLFLPGFKRHDGFEIGVGTHQTCVDDYWVALAALRKMPAPAFWRIAGDGNTGVVSCKPTDFDDVKRGYLEVQIVAHSST